MRRLTSILVAVVALIALTAGAKPMPPDLRARAFTVEPWLVEMAGAIKPDAGPRPEVFKERLAAALGTPLLTPSNRVDLFVQLQREIGISFEGGMPIPPKKNFAEFQGDLATFDRKVAGEPRLALEVEPLLKIAADEATSNTLRSGNALLLSAYADSARARPVLLKLIAPDRLAGSQCPPVALYIYTRAAVLCWDKEVERAYIALLSQLPAEEDREVAICALGINASLAGLQAIRETLIREDLPPDQALKTGLWILDKRMPAGEFPKFLAAAKAATKDPKRLKRLGEYAPDAPPESQPAGAFIKLWDGFDTKVYDEGALMIYGNGGFVGLLERRH